MLLNFVGICREEDDSKSGVETEAHSSEAGSTEARLASSFSVKNTKKRIIGAEPELTDNIDAESKSTDDDLLTEDEEDEELEQLTNTITQGGQSEFEELIQMANESPSDDIITQKQAEEFGKKVGKKVEKMNTASLVLTGIDGLRKLQKAEKENSYKDSDCFTGYEEDLSFEDEEKKFGPYHGYDTPEELHAECKKLLSVDGKYDPNNLSIARAMFVKKKAQHVAEQKAGLKSRWVVGIKLGIVLMIVFAELWRRVMSLFFNIKFLKTDEDVRRHEMEHKNKLTKYTDWITSDHILGEHYSVVKNKNGYRQRLNEETPNSVISWEAMIFKLVADSTPKALEEEMLRRKKYGIKEKKKIVCQERIQKIIRDELKNILSDHSKVDDNSIYEMSKKILHFDYYDYEKLGIESSKDKVPRSYSDNMEPTWFENNKNVGIVRKMICFLAMKDPRLQLTESGKTRCDNLVYGPRNACEEEMHSILKEMFPKMLLDERQVTMKDFRAFVDDMKKYKYEHKELGLHDRYYIPTTGYDSNYQPGWFDNLENVITTRRIMVAVARKRGLDVKPELIDWALYGPSDECEKKMYSIIEEIFPQILSDARPVTMKDLRELMDAINGYQYKAEELGAVGVKWHKDMPVDKDPAWFDKQANMTNTKRIIVAAAHKRGLDIKTASINWALYGARNESEKKMYSIIEEMFPQILSDARPVTMKDLRKLMDTITEYQYKIEELGLGYISDMPVDKDSKWFKDSQNVENAQRVIVAAAQKRGLDIKPESINWALYGPRNECEEKMYSIIEQMSHTMLQLPEQVTMKDLRGFVDNINRYKCKAEELGVVGVRYIMDMPVDQDSEWFNDQMNMTNTKKVIVAAAQKKGLKIKADYDVNNYHDPAFGVPTVLNKAQRYQEPWQILGSGITAGGK